MVNKLTKQQVVEGLVQIRHDLIEVHSNLEFKSVQDRWHAPDCLEWAINFIEKHEESGDTIKLPYKEHIFREGGDFWVVYYRNAKYGCIDGKWFDTEPEADEFLAQLKENKQC